MSKNNNDDKNKIRRRKVTSSNTDVNKNTSKGKKNNKTVKINKESEEKKAFELLSSAKNNIEIAFFDNDGNKKKGLGGGNCQVSTTLYNAVLKVSGLSVIERHEHSNKVPYIKSGKDAAVAYGSYDLKFRNNTGNDIRIEASATANNVSINLYKIF